MRNRNIDILIVEEDREAARSVEEALVSREIGGSKLICKSCEEAIQHLSHLLESGSGRSPKILIMEMQFSSGTGLELLKFIRDNRELNPISVFIFTKSEDNELRRRAFEFRVAGYLKKEEGVATVSDTILRLIDFWEICEFM